MPAITPAQLSVLQHNTKNIRNICILAHVDHGKTTLSDSLLATNGIISSKMAGKVRYLDSREDEQERGITMESSAISLYFKLVKTVDTEDAQTKTVENEYLINLIDSPGHVDFSSEVSTASRLCDGGLVLIDVVEGVCTQTISVLSQAWIDKVRPVLVFNKMDRLIVELQMTPHEAYIHINKILEQVNAVMATFFTGDLMESEARKMTDEKKENQEEEEFDANKIYDWSVEDRDDSDIYFDPARGNVIFSSAVDGWAFRVQQFASLYAKKLGFKEQVLQKCLWGEYYFDPKAKRVIQPKHLKGRNLKPMFVQFVLDNIWAVYGSVVIEPDRERVEKIVGALKIKILPRDLRSRDPNILLSAIFSQWLPLSTCVLLAIIGQLPPPKDAQRIRLPKMLYPNIHRKDSEPLEPTNDVEKALYSCDTSDEAPVVAYVSKMFAVPVEFLPENRRKQMTAEEMRERGQQQRELRAAHALLDQSGEGVPLTPEQVAALTEEAEIAEKEAEEVLKGESLIGFARIYSGKIRVGQKLYVMGPKYDPKYPKKHISEIEVKSLYLIMGRDLEMLDEVCAGNVFGIGGLEGHVLKNGTLASTTENVRNMAGVQMQSSPIVRVALEPEDPTEMDKLVEGLRLLNQADPCVEVMLQETGEHVILTAGELHLERCLRDLKERFAKIEIHASEPIVPFRETIVRADLSTNKEVEGVMVSRGESEIKINSKFLTLKVQTVPLPSRITEFLTKNAASIKAIVEEKLAKKSNKLEDEEASTGNADNLGGSNLLSATELESLLRKEFEQVKKAGGPFVHLWDNIVDQIWAFGPRRIGSNLLVNRIPGYVRKPFFQVDSKKSTEVSLDHADEVIKVDVDTSALSILDVDFHIHTGFQLSTLTGPLCAEPVTGVCYIVEGVEVHPEELVAANGEAIDVRSRLHIIQGQVIAATKEACRHGFLDWSPRLLLAMYTCDIQANAEVLGRVYAVISKRKGKIVSEDLKDGTSFWQINALLPVIESFGFSDEIRKRTSGVASPQLVFSGFEMLDEDPFWVPTTEEELEDLGEKADKENLAKKYMDTVRKRKGMFVEKKLVEHAEKQRTLKKN
ncbi:P-loop containing nucleoside triphosphate hydrolase protein [Mucor mucedo]|uniref:P-loop containing nucleoside triphosphate hydrolase protein n=1 Tax=Mucor mucedo TaxID=29922 RepID=UPI0022208DF5|nr:P-loop containing nucleoside triphosphate hydrolase protein [Mucor mucedo]KAI7892627.1 P-loop containing nucleoside triphosphate hydrolase protein [Mucor mucedo]